MELQTTTKKLPTTVQESYHAKLIHDRAIIMLTLVKMAIDHAEVIFNSIKIAPDHRKFPCMGLSVGSTKRVKTFFSFF
jgi:hypothetical protein